MRPILLYDGHCNFCIRVTKILEIVNRKRIKLLPFQSAGSLRSKFSLSEEEMTKKIHFVDSNGAIFRGSEAVVELVKFFPEFVFLSSFFKTGFGKKFYSLLSKNRYKIFGCSGTCYISKYS